MSNTPKKLYKYVKAERWNDLKTGYIRFTPPGELNDPFEMAPFYAEWMSDALFEKFIKDIKSQTINNLADVIAKDVWNRLSNHERVGTSLVELQNEIRAVALTNPRQFKQIHLDHFLANRHALDPATEGLVEITNHTFGVMSLTKKHDNRPMWAHYADNYTGLAIEFDASHSFFTKKDKKSSFSGLRRINYSMERPSAKYFLDEEHPYPNLYFSKSADWAYEEEYRLVKLLKSCNKAVPIADGKICHLYKLPADCVTGVILGLRMTEDCRREILDFLTADVRYKHVTIYESTQDDRTFNMNKCPI